MSMFECKQTDHQDNQSKVKRQGIARCVPCGSGAIQKTVLSFLVLLIIVLFSGQVRATSLADPSIMGSAKETRLIEPSFRMAQTSSSMENWQRRAFTAIELQKRLDNLARNKKNRIIRNRRIQRTLKRQNNIDALQRRAQKRQRNKIKRERVIKQAATRRRARRLSRIKNRSRLQTRQARGGVQQNTAIAEIVTEPGKIQRCLKKAGYFRGVVTGRLDDATLLAFLEFRDDKNLQSRPNDLYDPKTQEILFSLCPDQNLNSLQQLIANTLLGKKPVFVTSVKASVDKSEQAIEQVSVEPEVAKNEANEIQQADVEEMVDQSSENKKQARFPAVAGLSSKESNEGQAFAYDVLVQTDKPRDQLLTSSKNDRMARGHGVSAVGPESATSSYVMKRAFAKPVAQPVREKVRVASLPVKAPSVFSRKLSISDLAMAKPSNPNTCSFANHQPAMAQRPALAMSTLPFSSSRPLQMARNADEAPLTTGALSSTYLRKALRDNGRRNNRFLHPVEKEKSCLPQDLYDLIAKAHGKKGDLDVCKADCLPAPAAFSPGQKELFAEQYKINWCDTGCLGLAEPLPLKEVMKIEREARVHVCMTPQTKMGQAASTDLDDTGINRQIRALYDKLPGGYGNGDNIAVLIGNRNYARKRDVFDTSHINIAAMKALLLEQLGYKNENIIIIKDARRADFIRLFGRRGNADGELKRRLVANPDAQLMIYYSGHASSSGLGLNNYLLPVDAISGVESETSYSLSVLYDNLRELDARTTQLFLDASFNVNRSPMILAPNIAERRVNIAPIVPVRGLAVYTAATGDQKPLVDHETGLGMFTRFLIGGLAGKADERPIGNGDRVIDSVELYVHLAANVRLAARKTLGLKQDPTLSRTDNLFLSQLSRKTRR